MTSHAPGAPDSAPRSAALPAWGSLWRVVEVQAQNAFSDKVAQFTLLALANVLAVYQYYPQIVTIILVLPQLFFAPLAGWLSDRFSKRSVIIACSLSQVLLLVCVAGAFRVQLFWTATVLFFFLAIQAALLFPAKSGICKELVGEKNLTKSSGWIQMTTMLAFALGQLIGGKGFQFFHDRVFTDVVGDPHLRAYKAAAAATLLLAGLALLPLVLAFQVKHTPAHSAERFQRGLLTQHFRDFTELFEEKRIRLTAFGVSFFWLVATMLMMVSIRLAEVIEPNRAAQAGLSAEFLCYIAGGVVVGSLITALISGERIELGLVPIGGVGMAVCSVLASGCDPYGMGFRVFVLGVGAFSAMFLIPTSAHLLNIVEPHRRGRILSASGLMDSLGMISGVAIQFACMKLGTSVKGQLLTLGVLCLVAAVIVMRIIPQNFIRFTTLSLIRIVYRVRVVHGERIPETGGALLVCNHVSYIDALLLSAACERPVRFTAFDDFFKNPLLNVLLRLFGVVPISNKRAKDAIVALSEALKEGHLVCIFPEGQLTRTGMLNEIRKGFELIARKADRPVIPVFLDDLWGSIFSFERGRYFRKHPHHFPYHVSVLFGTPIPAGEATVAVVRDRLQELSADGLVRRGVVQRGFPQAVAGALSQEPWRLAVMEGDGSERHLRRAEFFGRAAQLAQRWKDLPTQAIGVVLPPGVNAALANAGLVLAGKTAVNLAPDAAAAVVRETMEREHIATIITSVTARQGAPHFPWPGHILDMVAEVTESDEFHILGDSALAALLPGFAMRLRVRAAGGGIAGLAADGGWFAMGGQEVLVQTEMMRATDLLHGGDRLLSTMPLSTVAGAIAGLWCPLLQGVSLMHGAVPSAPGALSRSALRKGVLSFEPTLVLGAPHAGIIGSEKPPRAWIYAAGRPSERLLQSLPGTVFCPCYAGEALIAISMPDPPLVTTTGEEQVGRRDHSAGRLLPGVVVRPAAEGGAPLMVQMPGGLHASLPPQTRVDAEGFIFPPPTCAT